MWQVNKVSQDLQLAKAVKKYPDVARAKTKREALRKLKQIEKKPEPLPQGLFNVIYAASGGTLGSNRRGRSADSVATTVFR